MSYKIVSLRQGVRRNPDAVINRKLVIGFIAGHIVWLVKGHAEIFDDAKKVLSDSIEALNIGVHVRNGYTKGS